MDKSGSYTEFSQKSSTSEAEKPSEKSEQEKTASKKDPHESQIRNDSDGIFELNPEDSNKLNFYLTNNCLNENFFIS
uniref:Uncharacterized protein n=1 Tax=Panagrolaimus sp. JU765 TaxID=591449 RepID=A0AC34QCZ0_9BILA